MPSSLPPPGWALTSATGYWTGGCDLGERVVDRVAGVSAAHTVRSGNDGYHRGRCPSRGRHRYPLPAVLLTESVPLAYLDRQASGLVYIRSARSTAVALSCVANDAAAGLAPVALSAAGPSHESGSGADDAAVLLCLSLHSIVSCGRCVVQFLDDLPERHRNYELANSPRGECPQGQQLFSIVLDTPSYVH
ncbi:unnamed protein product [Aspergillus oryzae]|nr:unnamed protein product [Aspergillus oryzae]